MALLQHETFNIKQVDVLVHESILKHKWKFLVWVGGWQITVVA